MRSLLGYVLLRGISSVLTVSLFGLIANRLLADELANALSFSLIFGFFVSLSRNLVNFVARLQPDQDMETKLIAVAIGYKTTLYSLIILSPTFLIISTAITDDVPISFVATIILIGASLDFDVQRAAYGKEMMFPRLFLLGTVLSITFFAATPNPSLTAAYYSTLLQWLPVFAYSIRTILVEQFQSVSTARTTIRNTIVCLLIASFDGLVLNTPLMPFVTYSAEVRTEIAIIIRIFASSLFILPFAMFLANRVSMDTSSQLYRYRSCIFFIGVSATSYASFLAYLLYFQVISGQEIPAAAFSTVPILILGFSAYYTQARFMGRLQDAFAPIGYALLLIPLSAMGMLTLFSTEPPQVIFIQACAFGTIALVIFIGQRMRHS